MGTINRHTNWRRSANWGAGKSKHPKQLPRSPIASPEHFGRLFSGQTVSHLFQGLAMVLAVPVERERQSLGLAAPAAPNLSGRNVLLIRVLFLSYALVGHFAMALASTRMKEITLPVA